MSWKNESKDGKEYDKDGKEAEGGGHYMDKAGGICPMKKAEDLTEDDLQKSLDQLEELASSGDETSRKDELLVKAQLDDLSDVERDELFQILGGDGFTQTEEPTITKSMTSNESLQKAVDVSDYLREQHTELVKSLDMVSEEIQKSDRRRQELDLIMAKAVHSIGTMVKAMSSRLGVIENTPARAPKSRGVPGAQPLQKAFAGQPVPGEQLSKSDILDGMEALHRDLIQKGGDTKIGGEDLMMAISRYESTHQISPAMLQAVQNHRASVAN